MSPCIVLQRATAGENVGNVTVGDVGLLRSSFQEDSAKAAGISVRLFMRKTRSAALDSSWPRLTIVPVFYFAGAAIVRSKTSPSWIGSGRVFWQSLPLVAYMRPPEVILEPDNHPGNCWPFPGSQGHVFIKLPVAVFPTAVTINHGVPAAAYHADSISSAPKDFAVYGLQEEDDEKGTLLGEFIFTPGQAPGQTFQLKNEHSGFIKYVRLQVLSNWGHRDYTCVYQFRLHGDPAHDGDTRGKLSA